MTRQQLTVGIASFIGMTVSAPALLSTTPLLLEPTSHEFGWGRATISMALLIASPLTALSYILIGRLLDLFGARRILIPGYVLCGGSMMLMSQLNGSITQLIVLQVFSMLCGTLVTGIAFGNIISRYFSTNRGTLLGLCLGAGGGLGMTVMPLIGAALLEHGGWRTTYFGVGLIGLLLGLPAALALPRHRPPATAEAPTNVAVAEGLEGKVAIFKPAYLLMLGATCLTCMVINGIGGHMAAIMTDHGMTHTMAAAALSVYAGSMMAAQFGIGMLLDKLQTRRIIIPVFGIVLCGVVALQFSTSTAGLFLGAAMIGAGAGSEYSILPYFLTRLFGVRAFGLLYGTIYAIAAVGTGIGPFAMGKAFDITGSYSTALTAFEAALLISIVLMLFLSPYRYAANGKPLEDESIDDRLLAKASA
ncbi:MFS transporter [Sphingomonas sp. MMS24-J13]|uniref:MFS transporter n=1 Tax=Sphingomonas sp. MMS24-J13 TaxID=3238686 RepID=UPI00384DE6F7